MELENSKKNELSSSFNSFPFRDINSNQQEGLKIKFYSLLNVLNNIYSLIIKIR